MGLCETQQFRTLGEDTIGCDECAGIMLKGVKILQDKCLNCNSLQLHI